MNEQTSPTADQAIGHPADQPASHPRKKKRHASTWIALASAGAAIVAAAISGYQVNLAGKQNTEAEQAQLANLTTIIAQQFTQMETANNQTTGSLSAQDVAAHTLQGRVAQLQVYGQAGAALIQSLKGSGVASVEYIEVGRALDFTGDTPDAITYYKDALTAPPHAPYTRATALRFLGFVYYGLGRNVIAHQYMMRATKIFGRHLLLYQSTVANTIAQGYVEDAQWQIYINGCRIAAADMAAAQRVMGTYTEDAVTQSYVNADTKAYPSKCNGSG